MAQINLSPVINVPDITKIILLGMNIDQVADVVHVILQMQSSGGFVYKLNGRESTVLRIANGVCDRLSRNPFGNYDNRWQVNQVTVAAGYTNLLTDFRTGGATPADHEAADRRVLQRGLTDGWINADIPGASGNIT